LNEYTEDYDVVVATLQKKYDVLWKMTQSNMNIDMINIMDDIRLKQMDELEQAINMWKSRNERKD
jgi:hypothetical protein